LIKPPAIAFRIHPVFWLIVAAGIVTGRFWETSIAFLIVLIHESGHVTAAILLGWRVERIELLPFGGVAVLDERQERPFYQEALIIAAGPLQNVWIALFLPSLLHLLPDSAHLDILMRQNGAILLFNLLPIWPLDGGRMLHLALQKVYPYKTAYRRALSFSFFSLGVFGLSMLILIRWSLSLWLVVSFVAYAIASERRLLPLRFTRFLLAVAARRQSPRVIRSLIVDSKMPIVAVFSHFYRNVGTRIWLRGRRQVIEDRQLLAAYFGGKGAGGTVGDWLTPPK
jgi:stage IV sporulation protein FB